MTIARVRLFTQMLNTQIQIGSAVSELKLMQTVFEFGTDYDNRREKSSSLMNRNKANENLDGTSIFMS